MRKHVGPLLSIVFVAVMVGVLGSVSWPIPTLQGSIKWSKPWFCTTDPTAAAIYRCQTGTLIDDIQQESVRRAREMTAPNR